MTIDQTVSSGGMLVEMRRGHRGRTLAQQLIFTPEQIHHTPRGLIVSSILRMLDDLDRTQQAIDDEAASEG